MAVGKVRAFIHGDCSNVTQVVREDECVKRDVVLEHVFSHAVQRGGQVDMAQVAAIVESGKVNATEPLRDLHSLQSRLVEHELGEGVDPSRNLD